MIRGIVTLEDNNIRLDRWFKRQYSQLSFGWVARNVRKGLVRVNSKKVDIAVKVLQGDIITYPEPLVDSISSKPAVINPKDEARVLASIIYKDDDIIVLNKPEGLAVQGGTGISKSIDSLADVLKFGYDHKPKLVHRLDRKTSGILILARKSNIAAELADQFRHKNLKKTYLALVQGILKPGFGKIDIPIEKIQRAHFEKVEKSATGKRAITYYKTLDRAADQYSLIELELVTGRTHQLRVHMAAMKCPIVGDDKYGIRLPKGDLIATKLYLHAYSIEFYLSNRPYAFKAPLPSYFQETLNNLGFSPLI